MSKPVFDPQNQSWNERINSRKLSSGLHIHCSCTHMPAFLHNHLQHHACVCTYGRIKHMFKSPLLPPTHHFNSPYIAHIPPFHRGPWILLVLSSHSAILPPCLPTKYNKGTGINGGHSSCDIFHLHLLPYFLLLSCDLIFLAQWLKGITKGRK